MVLVVVTVFSHTSSHKVIIKDCPRGIFILRKSASYSTWSRTSYLLRTLKFSPDILILTTCLGLDNRNSLIEAADASIRILSHDLLKKSKRVIHGIIRLRNDQVTTIEGSNHLFIVGVRELDKMLKDLTSSHKTALMSISSLGTGGAIPS